MIILQEGMFWIQNIDSDERKKITSQHQSVRFTDACYFGNEKTMATVSAQGIIDIYECSVV